MGSKKRQFSLQSSPAMASGGDSAMDVDFPEVDGAESVVVSRKESSKRTLPWIEKYRPTSLADLISQDEIVSTSA